ncbi:uncharacterized protein HMPREF1541_01302 [Cyphellophora europaea CBS 101466]|uniref:Uncharacterized protein n=1 Tax=Cyphellophora europaea (strain CBS 101466) TaxID=1220924 RepID=W2SEJ3_CYPE1|nr:uncharacterized protein HMPREF1541_01302 [Cyphellophora europaea CBS 101466]ETN47112.1 hypothetical protein HMPREF1541_01302 [Cyphellophora europaea CBS 101466]
MRIPRRLRCQHLLTLPFEIRERIWTFLLASPAKVRCRRQTHNSDEPAATLEERGSALLTKNYKIDLPYAGSVQACKQLKHELTLLIRMAGRFLRIDDLWLHTSLPEFFESDNHRHRKPHPIVSSQHVKTLLVRTSEPNTCAANDLRDKAVMLGYMARIRRDRLENELNLKLEGHRAWVEDERLVGPGRVLLFVVHEVILEG